MRIGFGSPDLAKFGIAAALSMAIAGCSRPSTENAAQVNPTSNMIAITAQDEILWNGEPVTLAELETNLRTSTSGDVEPELRFEPAVGASYETSADVLNIVKSSGVRKFGFVGNERYAVPGKDAAPE